MCVCLCVREGVVGEGGSRIGVTVHTLPKQVLIVFEKEEQN